ncbi:MAG: serine protease [Arenicella sp.]|nr:serine protease [Arenicella sp.]
MIESTRKYAVLCTLLFTLNPAVGQIDEDFMQSYSVRVIAKSDGITKASSGFLWGNTNQVVTTLHSIPKGSQITVQCRGATQKASISKTLRKADLILLDVNGLPDACRAFTSFDATKPKRGAPLWTFGYHAGARSLTDREFKKRSAIPESLGYLLSGKPLKAIKELGFPAVDLDIYYVQGGLLPRYSGGPVLDQRNNLIGVVDGGLNKGASSYNWVIPAKFLNELTASTDAAVPAGTAQALSTHFASGIAFENRITMVKAPEVFEPDHLELTALNRPGFDDKLDRRLVYVPEFLWVFTKTLSLYDLAATADDAEGVEQLFHAFSEAAGVTDPEKLDFDIYEEQTEGLIIAVPAGQGLGYVDDGSGELRLHSGYRDGGIWFDAGGVYLENELGGEILPRADDYFQHFIADTLARCHEPLISECILEEGATRIIDFGGGNKILRFAVVTLDYSTSKPQEFNYYTLATSGNYPFLARASILPHGNSGLLQCITGGEAQACENTSLATTQFMQMLAVHLTSFSELSSGGEQKIANTEFTYDNKWDNPATVFVPYFDGAELRFFNERGKIWRVYFDDEDETAIEERRDQNGNAVLKYGKDYYSLPAAGGDYYKSTAGGKWEPAGSLRKVTPSMLTYYIEGSKLRFLNTGGVYWSVYADNDSEDTQELRRDTNETGARSAILQFDDTYYSVPLSGGQYFKANADNQWEPAGTVQRLAN